MSRYKAYAEYKDSGVEWIGSIPTDWDMWKIFHACPYVASGTTPKSDGDHYYDGSILWVTTGELRESVVFDTQKKVTHKALVDMPTLRLHPKGSVAIAMYGATIGRLGILGDDATTNQACCVMPPSEVLHSKYLFYWLYATRQEIINLSSGGGQPNVNQEKIASLKVSAPNHLLQEKIAAFLDHETAKIDTLIEKQQRLIELLKEKRQAVISHAVTKGLNPNAPMKDSGVEWLGEVPAHWPVLPLKRVLELQRGHDLPAESRIEGRIPVVSSGGIIGYHNEFKAIGPGIITGRYGTIGEFYLEKNDYWPLNTSLYTVNTYANDVDYLWYMLQNIKHLFVLNSIKSAVPGVDRNDLHTELISLPLDLVEQKQIVDYLNKNLVDIDRVSNKARQAIELMQERRTALISAAVTGKIDVRDWQPAAAQDEAGIEC